MTFNGTTTISRRWTESTILVDVEASADEVLGQLVYASGHWGWRMWNVSNGAKGPLIIRGPVPCKKATGAGTALTPGQLVEAYLVGTEYYVKALGSGPPAGTGRPRVVGKVYYAATVDDARVDVDLDPNLEQDYYTVEGAALIQDAGGASLEIDIEAGIVVVNGNVIEVAAAANAATATAASAGKEKVAIVQIEDDGTISFKSGTEVTLAAGTAEYPEPDADCMLLAKIGTAASPIVEGTTQITTAMIFNSARRRL